MMTLPERISIDTFTLRPLAAEMELQIKRSLNKLDGELRPGDVELCLEAVLLTAIQYGLPLMMSIRVAAERAEEDEVERARRLVR